LKTYGEGDHCSPITTVSCSPGTKRSGTPSLGLAGEVRIVPTTSTELVMVVRNYDLAREPTAFAGTTATELSDMRARCDAFGGGRCDVDLMALRTSLR
jgi:hypothetical protein